MEAIDSIAREYAFAFGETELTPNLSKVDCYEAGFGSGVKFAQRWIPIEEDMPEIDETVLMKNSFGCYGVGKWDGKDWTFYTIEGVAKLSNWISKECTHWRPIELK